MFMQSFQKKKKKVGWSSMTLVFHTHHSHHFSFQAYRVPISVPELCFFSPLAAEKLPEAITTQVHSCGVNCTACYQIGSNIKCIVLQLPLIKISSMCALFQMRQPDEKKQQVIIIKQVNKALLELRRNYQKLLGIIYWHQGIEKEENVK